MTIPPEVYEAAARAYCLTWFTYDAAYVEDGREQHIARDVAATATDGYLRGIVETVWKLARREGICGDECAPLLGISGAATCVLSHGHASEWHEDEQGCRWRHGTATLDDEARRELVAEGRRQAAEAIRAEADRFTATFGHGGGTTRATRDALDRAARVAEGTTDG